MANRPRMLMPAGADPFNFTKRQTAVRKGLRNAPKANPSSGFLGALMHMLGGMQFGDDHFSNQKSRAEAHLPYDVKGLSPQQVHLLAQIFAGGKGHSY